MSEAVSAVAPAGAERRPPSVADLQGPPDRVAHIRRVPRLVREALAVVWRAGRGHLVLTGVLQLAMALGVAVQLLISRQLLTALGAAAGGASHAALYGWLGALAATTAVLGALAALAAYEQKLLAELTARHAFDSIIGVAGTVDFRAFEDPEFYDQLQRARNAGMYRTLDMVNSLLTLTAGLLTTVSIALVIYLLEPLLLVFVGVAALFPLAAAMHNGRKTYNFEYAMTAESRERLYVMNLLTEREPAKEIRIFGSGPFLRARWDALTAARIAQVKIFLAARLKVALLGSGAGSVAMTIALFAVVYGVVSGRMEVATALTAGLAMQQLSSRLTNLTGGVGTLIESGMFLDDYSRFLELAPAAEADESPQTVRREPFAGLRAEHVSFTYPGSSRRALDDVSIEIERGEVVALVGENGSGKTTLVKLICQLYRPESGRILWNGRDTAGISPAEIRDDMTVLFQDYVQYFLSARDNIVIGRPDSAADVERVRLAAERAGASGFLSGLPEGLETRLGREFYGGHELSVGQWQRLALARAFFRAGGFLVLDEPTASLDPRAESELFEQVRGLAGGRSVLLVSHRFSSVRSADRIYVLEQGSVIESGPHDELMARGGTYAELFTLQAEAYLGSAAAV